MGCLMMKTKTIIKEKEQKTKKQKINLILTIAFIIISSGCGFLISYFGNGSSFIENDLITSIITLFGFGLTSTVFVYQAFKDKESDKTSRVIKSLAKTLLLTFILIIVALILDFLSSLSISNCFTIIINSLKFASLIYAFICQVDILLSFIIIIKN